jgi:trehalose/maltose transport system substrate-binding protein
MAKGWVGTISPKGVTSYKEEETRNAWQGGHAAFLRNWPYVYALSNGEASAVKATFDVTYLPQGDGPNASHGATFGGWQLMLSAYSKNKDAAAKLIKYLVSFETQKEHAIKLSRLPTLPAVYKDKDVLAAQPWFARLQPVFENAVARPSTVTGADYNKVSTAFFQTTNQILNGAVPAEEELKVMESKIKRFTLELFNWRLCESLSLGLRERILFSYDKNEGTPRRDLQSLPCSLRMVKKLSQQRRRTGQSGTTSRGRAAGVAATTWL